METLKVNANVIDLSRAEMTEISGGAAWVWPVIKVALVIAGLIAGTQEAR